MSHTPGPWFADKAWRVVSSDPRHTVLLEPTGSLTDPTVQCDSVLAAAAPCLLAALEASNAALQFANELLAAYEEGATGEVFNSPLINTAIEDGSAAIAKARGTEVET